MARMTLTLKTLSDFDFGKAEKAFLRSLKTVVDDCRDRPGEKKPRQVILTAYLTPRLEEDGNLDECDVEFTCVPKIPPFRTAPKPVGVTTSGQLYFNDMAPDNPGLYNDNGSLQTLYRGASHARHKDKPPHTAHTPCRHRCGATCISQWHS